MRESSEVFQLPKKPSLTLSEYKGLRQQAIDKASRLITSGKSYKRRIRLMMTSTPLVADRLWLLASARSVTMSELLYSIITTNLDAEEQKTLNTLS